MSFIKDSECTQKTPLIYGLPAVKIYGNGTPILPRIPGKNRTEWEKKSYLESLFPLEVYDKIIVLISAGKDSVACLLHLLELGVDPSRIELWHHDIDGGSTHLKMDWPTTKSYIIALSKAFSIPVRFSWRENGFYGELFREGASFPVVFEDGFDERKVYSKKWGKSEDLKAELLKAEVTNDLELITNFKSELHLLGKRLKFPAKAASLSTRWCSSYLKICVADSVLSSLDGYKENSKILLVSGERRGESKNRSQYNEMEIHRKNAAKIKKRLIHQWRPVIDWSEKDVWEIIKRHSVTPHPCYRAGWNRCSCAMCIFSSPKHFKGVSELLPDYFNKLVEIEAQLGFTLDNKKSLKEFIGNCKSCLYTGDKSAIEQLTTGIFEERDIFTSQWEYPAGAFKGSDGGPC